MVEAIEKTASTISYALLSSGMVGFFFSYFAILYDVFFLRVALIRSFATVGFKVFYFIVAYRLQLE